MKDITSYIILFASLITACTTICAFCKRVINKCFEPLVKKIDKIDENQCRNFLVNFLADVEKRSRKRRSTSKACI